MEKVPSKMKHSFHFKQLKLAKGGRRIVEAKIDHAKAVGRLGRIVTFTLFTANLNARPSRVGHIYLLGTLQNCLMAPLVYPGWKVVVYVDGSSRERFPRLYDHYLRLIIKHAGRTSLLVQVDWRTTWARARDRQAVRQQFGHDHWTSKGCDLALMMAEAQDRPGNLPLQFAKTLYRMFPAELDVTFLSRDADARLNIREKVAVDQWLSGPARFCRIFDNRGHANPLLAGMWSGRAVCSHAGKRFASGIVDECKQAGSIPNFIDRVAAFLADRDRLGRGYGIDEAFLGTLDQELRADHYQDLVTFGKGTYYTGSAVFSQLKGSHDGLKIGERMVTLVPCGGPDQLEVKAARGWERAKDGSLLLGREIYFVGEDLVCKAPVPGPIVNWLVWWSVNHAKSKGARDLEPEQLAKQFERFEISLRPSRVSRDLASMSLAVFARSYGFDKRILPQFWYCLLNGTGASVPFFESLHSFNPNQAETVVFEKANRLALLEHPKLWPKVLGARITGTQWVEFQPALLSFLTGAATSGPLAVPGTRIDLKEYFRTVKRATVKASSVYGLLSSDLERLGYWHEMIMVYPVAAVRDFNLASVRLS